MTKPAQQLHSMAIGRAKHEKVQLQTGKKKYEKYEKISQSGTAWTRSAGENCAEEIHRQNA